MTYYRQGNAASVGGNNVPPTPVKHHATSNALIAARVNSHYYVHSRSHRLRRQVLSETSSLSGERSSHSKHVVLSSPDEWFGPTSDQQTTYVRLYGRSKQRSNILFRRGTTPRTNIFAELLCDGTQLSGAHGRPVQLLVNSFINVTCPVQSDEERIGVVEDARKNEYTALQFEYINWS